MTRPTQRRPMSTKARAIAEVPLEDFNESKNIMVYGFTGCGKTVLGGTAPNAVILGTEPGVIAAKRAGSKAGLVRITSSRDAWTWLEDAQNGKYSHRDWAIVDTVSMLQHRILRNTMKELVAVKPTRDIDLPDRAEHQKMQNELKRWVEQVVDLPINTLFLAHAMRVEDIDGGGMMIPHIEGGASKGYTISNYVSALMNAVGYMGVRTIKRRGEDPREVRRILWQPYHDADKDIMYQAKDQFAAFGRYTDDIDMPGLLAKLEQPTARRTRARASN